MTHSHTSQRGRRVVAAIAIAAITIASALTIGASSAQAQTITQGPNASPLYGIGTPPYLATVGQTFLAPTTGSLDSFSFWLSNEGNALASNTIDADQLQFQAYVMQWDVATLRAVGPILFSSVVYSGPTQISQEFQFATAGVAVMARTPYVAFLSASGLFGNMPPEVMAALLLSDDATADGSLVFLDSQNDVSMFSNAEWLDGAGLQTQFSATFSTTVPEPSSVVLVGIALIGLAVSAHYRKRQA